MGSKRRRRWGRGGRGGRGEGGGSIHNKSYARLLQSIDDSSGTPNGTWIEHTGLGVGG